MRTRRLLVGLIVVGLVLLVVRGFFGIRPDVEEGSVLVLDLGGQYVEAAEPSLLSRLLGDARKPFVSLLSELRKAERDDRLAGVVLRIRPLGLGWAKAQEIRDAIASLRHAGRPTAAYLEIESFAGNLEYYVASAADSVYLAPATRAPLIGLAAEYLFLGGFFEMLGVDLEVERIGRYKTAADTFAAKTMSEAGREMADSILDSIDAQFVAGIAGGRGLTEDFVRSAIDSAPVSPGEMEALDLVDGVATQQEVVRKLGDGPVVEADVYARVDPATVGFQPAARFALVYGSGPVVSGSGRWSRSGDPVLASDTVSEALRKASEDDSIDAIIFRIDSPGGSALASDVVWDATQRARAKGVPVVASLSDVAASGGYYVAAGADAIVASPATLTGSIGVFVLRPVLSGLLEKLGLGVVALTRGEHADLLVASKPLSEGTRARLRAEVESIYELFVARVSDGRELASERVDALGRGRVWTGAQAGERGLVDRLGGLRTAVERAKEKLDLAPGDDVVLVPYPPPPTLAEQLTQAFRGAVRGLAAAAPLPPIVARMRAWLEELPPGAPLALSPVVFEIR